MATILGGDQDDPLTGTEGNDLLIGLAGADTLAGDAGDDTLDAGTGADRLDGGAGMDRALIDRSGVARDLLVFVLAPGFTTVIDGAELTGIEHLSLVTGTGADRLVGGAGDDMLSAGGNADALFGGAGDDTLLGGDGADTLMGGSGADLLEGGSGADRFALQDALAATAGSRLGALDTIRGFSAAEGDRLWLRGQSAAGGVLALDGPGRFGLPGEATAPIGFGGSLAPRAAPEAGLSLPDATGGAAFRLFWMPSATAGDAGGWVILDLDRDGLLGATDLVIRLEFAAFTGSITAADFAPGSFALLGTTGADGISATTGDDTVHGFGGADLLFGRDGNDSLLGGEGADSLAGEAGFDTLRGGEGADSLSGGTGADVLDGGTEADRLEGGDGADLLLGGAGADLLLGGLGDDTLEGAGRGEAMPLPGAEGGDTLTGGAGADLFVLQGSGDPAWSGPGAISVVTDFNRTEGDRLRIGEAGTGGAAGTLAGTDGIARPLVFSGSPGQGQVALTPGQRLPAQPLPGLDAIQVFWIPAVTAGGAAAGGWLVLDLDQDGRLGAADSVTRLGSAEAPVQIGPADFAPGSFLAFGGAAAPVGTAGADRLRGGSRSETVLGTAGRDTIDGGAGAPNAITYAALDGPVSYAALAAGQGFGVVEKADGARDLLRAFQAVTGTAHADTLDAAAAPAEAVYVLSLEGGAGDDRIIGNGSLAVQASYAGGTAAARIDLAAGIATDGWGATDTLLGIRRVAATSAFDDTLTGSAADEVFLSGALGSRRIEGGGGFDEYRYAGTGAVTIVLAEEIVGLFRLPARADKPGGARDLLTGISSAVGGAGDDVLRGGAGEERLAGGPGNDTLDGGAGLDTVSYDILSTVAGLAQRGVVLDLSAGTATDPWGGTDVLLNLEHAWGTRLADDMTGRAVPGQRSLLRGLAGDDTLRAPAGGGLVMADHAADPTGIAADLGAGWALDGWGGRDLLVGLTGLVGSAFADTVTGSAAADVIEGGGENDSLAGAGGADRLLGGEGDDTLDGGAGTDTLAGGAGNDLYLVDAATDRVEDPEGGGTDTVVSSVAFYLPPTIEVLVLAAAAGGILGVGNALANRLTGNGAANLLLAQGGADTVEGGAGNDTLYGQDGTDLLQGGADNDWALGGEGVDTLRGDAGNDILYGEAGDDLMQGGDGTDWLFGGTGADRLEGGESNDILYGQDGADILAGDGGTDRLIGGTGNDTLSGGDANDILYGEGDDDLMQGGTGVDWLIGGTGADRLEGGDGNDVLYGQDGADRLQGDAGVDYLIAGTGEDTLDGGEQPDVLYGEAGNDLIYGGTGLFTDRLFGGDGNDTLDGSGAPGTGLRNRGDFDLMAGGAGDDVYWVDTPSDRLFESPGGGYDVVHAEIAGGGFTLWPQLEELILHGATFSGTGNDLANRIVGTGLANWLLGGAGNDTLVGGGGADVLYGQAGADLLVYGGGGRTTIADFVPGLDRIRLEGLAPADFAGAMATARQFGTNLAFDFGGSNMLVLQNITAAQLSARDFDFG